MQYINISFSNGNSLRFGINDTKGINVSEEEFNNLKKWLNNDRSSVPDKTVKTICDGQYTLQAKYIIYFNIKDL